MDNTVPVLRLRNVQTLNNKQRVPTCSRRTTPPPTALWAGAGVSMAPACPAVSGPPCQPPPPSPNPSPNNPPWLVGALPVCPWGSRLVGAGAGAGAACRMA